MSAIPDCQKHPSMGNLKDLAEGINKMFYSTCSELSTVFFWVEGLAMFGESVIATMSVG